MFEHVFAYHNRMIVLSPTSEGVLRHAQAIKTLMLEYYL